MSPRLHTPDCRHTGNMLAAPGANLGDLKARMGHGSARAAMIYQHATAEADRMIANALDKRIEDSGKPPIPARTMTTGRPGHRRPQASAR